MCKDIIRDEMKSKRKALSHDFIEYASEKIKNTVLNSIKDAKCVMIYLSSFKEPDTFALFKELQNRGIKTVVPVSDTTTFTITPSLVTNDDLVKGAYGIYEPKSVVPVSASDIDIALIPGIAFSKKGDRLGFGKGYYDRFLSEFRGTKIGICYDFQILSDIPVSSHDVKMDYIITETRIYNDF